MMRQQKNRKVLVYFFLFFLLGTISNKNLNKFEIPKAKKVFSYSILYLFLLFVLFLVDKIF